MALKYNDLWNTFMQAREKPLPPRFAPIQTGTSRKPNFLSADNLSRVIQSFSPFDFSPLAINWDLERLLAAV